MIYVKIVEKRKQLSRIMFFSVNIMIISFCKQRSHKINPLICKMKSNLKINNNYNNKTNEIINSNNKCWRRNIKFVINKIDVKIKNLILRKKYLMNIFKFKNFIKINKY